MINVIVRTVLNRLTLGKNMLSEFVLRSGDSYRILPFSSGSDVVTPSTGDHVLVENSNYRLLENGDRLLLG